MSSSACVWCRESLPMLKAPPACPSCGKGLLDGAGARLRRLDLDFERLLADADASSLRWLVGGAIFAFVAALLGVVWSPLSFVAFGLLFAGQFFWTRFLVARPYARHFAAPRRFVTRWLTRLFLLLVVMPLHGAFLAIPFAGPVLSPLLFLGTCRTFREYFRFHFLREHRREGVLAVEKVFLVLLAVVFVLVIVFFAVIAAVVMSLLPGSAGR